MKAGLNLFLILFLFGWLVISDFSPASVACGAAMAILVAVLAYRIFYPRFESGHFRISFPRITLALLYVLILLRNIFLASFSVARVILGGKSQPRVVRIRTRLKNPTARVILALSITLTPGTLTVDMDGPYVYVHWLQARTTHSIKAGDLIKGDLEYLLERMFESPGD
jgi:multicomponent Na+:H+ antiporter subunit E